MCQNTRSITSILSLWLTTRRRWRRWVEAKTRKPLSILFGFFPRRLFFSSLCLCFMPSYYYIRRDRNGFECGRVFLLYRWDSPAQSSKQIKNNNAHKNNHRRMARAKKSRKIHIWNISKDIFNLFNSHLFFDSLIVFFLSSSSYCWSSTPTPDRTCVLLVLSLVEYCFVVWSVVFCTLFALLLALPLIFKVVQQEIHNSRFALAR